ncbi:hypothetical protein U1Q18_005758 [Sarracenia purpurea var. burkii]
MGTTTSPLLLDSSDCREEERNAVCGYVREFGTESKKLWKIAGPTIVTALCQFSLGALSQTFVGQVGEIELAAFSVANSVVAGLAFGVMLGMGSALETLCGQAFGAGQLEMLGAYMQRSWVILLTTACILVPIYVFSPPILEFFGETVEISEAAEILASTEESTSNNLGIRCCAVDTCIFQLAADTKAGMGFDGGRNHSQRFMVAHRDWAVALHFHHQIRWCLEWIHLACIRKLMGLCEAFFGFGHNVMVYTLLLYQVYFFFPLEKLLSRKGMES